MQVFSLGFFTVCRRRCEDDVWGRTHSSVRAKRSKRGSKPSAKAGGFCFCLCGRIPARPRDASIIRT